MKKKLGSRSIACVRCGRHGGIIRKYELNYCRQCWREVAKKVGFKKYS